MNKLVLVFLLLFLFGCKPLDKIKQKLKKQKPQQIVILCSGGLPDYYCLKIHNEIR